jgi:hypothetical protein
MSVHLDASNYLTTAMGADSWGTAGTIFFQLYPRWASIDDGVDRHILFKSAPTFAGQGLFFDKYTTGETYIGWYQSGDPRITLTPAQTLTFFVLNAWTRYLYDWDTVNEFQHVYANNVVADSSDTAINLIIGIPQLTFGCHLSGGTASGGADCDYAEFGRWTRILTANERLTLDVTGCPLSVPNGLVQYYRMLDKDNTRADLAGTATLNRIGNITNGASNPRLYYPSSAIASSYQGTVTLELFPPLLSSPITLYAPSVGFAGVISPPLLSSPMTLYAPSVAQGVPGAAVGVSTYPPDIDSPSNLIIAANNKTSYLATALSISGMSLTVEDASTWPDSGALTLDLPLASAQTPASSEIVYYNGRAGNVLMLTARAVGGTTAKAWSVGSSVEGRAIAEHHNLHSSAIIALQTEVETKADTLHTHDTSSITGLDAALDAKAPVAHSHPMLPLTGGTLTGPLTLASGPTAALHAATKSYVDATSGGSSGSLLPNTYLVTEFNASGSMVTTSGTIPFGSNEVTLGDASSFAVGQGISIAGAGAAGALFVTTITNIAGNVVQLATTAATGVTGALTKHDDTAAIQNAIDTAVADGGGEILFPMGFYRCNRALQSATNSVLRLPFVNPGLSPPLALKLTGLTPISWFSWDAAVPQTNIGAIIQSDVTSLNPDSSLFAANLWDYSESTGNATHICLYIDQLRFRTYANPQLSGLDLGMLGGAALGFVSVETSGFWEGEPTFTGCFGLRMPKINTTMAMSRCDIAYIHNYHTGVVLSETPIYTSNHFFVMRCKVGYKCLRAFYPYAGLLFSWQCPTSIEVTDNFYFDINFFAEDAQVGNWNSPVVHISDTLDRLHGQVRYSIHESNSAAMHTLTKIGASAIVATNLRV